MKKLMILIATMIASPLFAADNEIYIEQSGATANIDIEQLGSWQYHWRSTLCGGYANAA